MRRDISPNSMRMQIGNSAGLLCRFVMVFVLIALALNLSNAALVFAFHYDSDFSCFGCHNEKGPSDHIYNLIGADQSSTCLRCHQRSDDDRQSGHYICTPDAKMPRGMPPLELSPGGDFGWLKKDYSWKSANVGRAYSSGEEHGHSIIAADFGYYAASQKTAPMGKYPSSALHCSSCHDPHGFYRRNWDGSISAAGAPIIGSGSYHDSPDPDVNSSVGVYRMLGGINYQPKSLEGEFAFTKAPPAAVSPRSYNRAEASTQTRVAYGAGMSEWCLNCHIYYDFKKNHPAGNAVKITNEQANYYNSYLSEDSPSKSYLSLVPFEVGSTDYARLKKLATNEDSELEGPVYANVSCLSCHRAHASGWDHSLRFNYHVRMTTVVGSDGKAAYPDPSTDPAFAQGRSIAEIKKAYYDREATKFGPRKKNLCSKCHGKE